MRCQRLGGPDHAGRDADVRTNHQFPPWIRPCYRVAVQVLVTAGDDELRLAFPELLLLTVHFIRPLYPAAKSRSRRSTAGIVDWASAPVEW
jgi:hypothetical protein